MRKERFKREKAVRNEETTREEITELAIEWKERVGEMQEEMRWKCSGDNTVKRIESNLKQIVAMEG